MLNLFSKNKNENPQKEWFEKGAKYAIAINEMVEFGEKHGWENWKGKEPEDKREHLADAVISLLRKANVDSTIEEFRKDFPPAHAPLIKYFEKKGQVIQDLHFISEEKICFILGAPYDQKRQSYILNGKTIEALDPSIISIGKSNQNNIFAIADKNSIKTYNGWQGKQIEEISYPNAESISISQLIPFNDGLKILLVSSEGIYLLEKTSTKLIHPTPDPESKDDSTYISMEHASLSPDNSLIALGDQDSEHKILNNKGNQIASIGQQSEYPHFTLFSIDGEQVIMNSCHFYNGTTIGVSTINIEGLKTEPYEESELHTIIDEGMRVYAGLSTNDYYILGDSYGYIKAVDKQGKRLWQHYLGSTIGGMCISDDKKTLWVASCTGMIHKLILGKGHNDSHTIGNGNHYEEFRMILWKGESLPLVW